MATSPGSRRPDVGVQVGQVFLGKYRVDEIIGYGGMGVVAKCFHLQLREPVAVKMLRKDVLDDSDAVERFMREAQAAVKLRSEYVARVSDVGRFEGGVPYMVMEFLDGHDLGALIDDRGALPAPWATEMMMQAAEALAEAHSIGIVHRDVKPTNLFVTWRPDGSALVKVLDFGISKAPLGVDMQLTQTQSLLGTPAYMSPEQMRSARMVDARSDIWSLGTVMYELLEGHRPFEADSFSEMCVKVAVDPPAPMHHTPPELQPIVLRCLAKSPEHRYSSMAALAAALQPFAPDPHAAAILVERMQRTLGRRNSLEWTVGPPPVPPPPPPEFAIGSVADDTPFGERETEEAPGPFGPVAREPRTSTPPPAPEPRAPRYASPPTYLPLDMSLSLPMEPAPIAQPAVDSAPHRHASLLDVQSDPDARVYSPIASATSGGARSNAEGVAESIEAPVPWSDTPRSEPRRRSRKAVWALALFALSALIGVTLGVVFDLGKKDATGMPIIQAAPPPPVSPPEPPPQQRAAPEVEAALPDDAPIEMVPAAKAPPKRPKRPPVKTPPVKTVKSTPREPVAPPPEPPKPKCVPLDNAHPC